MTPSKKGDNRRSWSRMPASAFPNVKATLNSGLDVELVNVSRGGAQIRTAKRLLPGLNVTLQLITTDGKLTMKGKVMRSSMVQLSTGALGYEVGVAFDLELGAPTRTPAQQKADEAKAASHALDAADAEAAATPPDAAAPSPQPAAATAKPSQPIDAGLEECIEPGPANRRGGRDRRRPDTKIEILDPDHKKNVDLSAEVPGESLDGLIDLLK